MSVLDRVLTRWLAPDLSETDALIALGPLTRDLCDTCHKPLHLNERVEVMVGEPEFDSEFGGSFAMLATYCTDHAPEAT